MLASPGIYTNTGDASLLDLDLAEQGAMGFQLRPLRQDSFNAADGSQSAPHRLEASGSGFQQR